MKVVASRPLPLQNKLFHVKSTKHRQLFESLKLQKKAASFQLKHFHQWILIKPMNLMMVFWGLFQCFLMLQLQSDCDSLTLTLWVWNSLTLWRKHNLLFSHLHRFFHRTLSLQVNISQVTVTSSANTFTVNLLTNFTSFRITSSFLSLGVDVE